MTQPTQEEIRNRAQELKILLCGDLFKQPNEVSRQIEWVLKRIAKNDLILESLQRNAGEETDEELYKIFRAQLTEYELETFTGFQLWKAGRASKR